MANHEIKKKGDFRAYMFNELANDSSYKLWVLLRQARDVLHKIREQEVAEFGITAEQAAVLFIVAHNEGKATPSLIASRLLREPHTISSILSRMEKQSLIEKKRKSEGNVEILVNLTEKGSRLYTKTSDMKLIRKLLSCIPEEEHEHISMLLKSVRDKGLSYLSSQRDIYP
jgi:MarR family transcriptional regulator, organic hydroperoxide resistance regulator